MMQSDRALGLVIALETALEDSRFEVRPFSLAVLRAILSVAVL